MNTKATVRASGREQHSPVFPLLAAYPSVHVEVAPLAAADYLLERGIAVKRKEAADFVTSIADRRLFRQVAAMQRDYERVVLIVEGDLLPYHVVLPPDIIRSAIAFLCVTKGISVVQTPNAQETAALLRVMARQAHKGRDHEVSFRVGKPRPADPSVVYLVEGLPGIGPRRARQLLECFGTPANIMRASPQELMQAPGIGPKRAQQIWDALNTHYTAHSTVG
ncbi:MAG: ERCC4 domain-containing protein [Anaerolineae bacterium]